MSLSYPTSDPVQTIGKTVFTKLKSTMMLLRHAAKSKKILNSQAQLCAKPHAMKVK